MKQPCIVAKRNNNPTDPRPHGQIIAIYPVNVDEILGENTVGSMLELFKRGSGDRYEYIKEEIEPNQTKMVDGFYSEIFHPDYYEEKTK